MILITGATGNNGTEIVKNLSAQGVPLRAMVHRAPGKDSLPPGVEIALADFDDAGSLRSALEGIQKAFLVTPSSEKVEEQQLRFVKLADEAGVKHVVYLSQLHAAPDSPVRFLRYHAKVEEALLDSGMKFTNLRPNLYMQGLLLFKDMIIEKGQIAAPIAGARISLVDVRDIADVAAAALTQPGHEQKTYDITGSEALTHSEIADALSEALGKRITFVDISESAMREALLSYHMPEWQADGLVEDYAHYKRGEAASVSSVVKDVTSHPPRDIAAFARDFRSYFLSGTS